ncbi:MAG: MazG family protein [Dehalococcoidia bacterium]
MPTTSSPSLDAVVAALGLAPHQVQAFDPEHPRFDAARGLLVLAPQFEAARPLVRARYAPATLARVVRDGVVEETAVATLSLDAAAWHLPPLAPEDDRGSIAGLRGVMERLFAPDGCPWDREQTPQTLRRYLLEEAYELVDAIDRDDAAGMREELGDLMAHLFMQTALAQQAGRFTAEDVAGYAHAKFVRRHPHVFGDEEAGSNQDLLDRWEAIKKAEREADGTSAAPPGALDSVPRAAPALQRVQSLLSRAQRAGLAAPAVDPTEAARAAIDAGDALALLVAAVRVAAAADVDAEEALREAAQRFTAAFVALEARARAASVEVAALPAEAAGAVWDALDEPPAGAP